GQAQVAEDLLEVAVPGAQRGERPGDRALERLAVGPRGAEELLPERHGVTRAEARELDHVAGGVRVVSHVVSPCLPGPGGAPCAARPDGMTKECTRSALDAITRHDMGWWA